MCPYITDERREALDTGHQLMGAGDLTYRLQQQLKEYLETKGLSYQAIAECLGALEGAKFDLLERVAKPYEQTKLTNNGDVWPASLTKAHLEPLRFGDGSREALITQPRVGAYAGVPDRGPAETSI